MKKWLLTLSFLAMLGVSGCALEESRLEPIHASIEIQFPCTDPLHVQLPQESAEGPFIIAEPQCGNLAKDIDVPGTEIALSGRGFYPNTMTSIFWVDSLGNEFRHRQAGEYLEPITDQEGGFSISLEMPYRLLPSSPSEDYQVWKLTAFQGEPVEEAEPILWERVFEQIYISVVGGVIGIGAGAFVGYYLARVLNNLIVSAPSIRIAGFFFPWRALLISQLMHLILPVKLITLFGFGAKSGVFWTSVSLFVFAVSFLSTVCLWKWQGVSFTNQLRSVVRTLAVLSVFLSTWLGYFGMGGIGHLIYVHIALLEYDVAMRYYLLLVVMVAFVDLLGGCIAFLLERRETALSSEPVN